MRSFLGHTRLWKLVSSTIRSVFFKFEQNISHKWIKLIWLFLKKLNLPDVIEVCRYIKACIHPLSNLKEYVVYSTQFWSKEKVTWSAVSFIMNYFLYKTRKQTGESPVAILIGEWDPVTECLYTWNLQDSLLYKQRIACLHYKNCRLDFTRPHGVMWILIVRVR